MCRVNPPPPPLRLSTLSSLLQAVSRRDQPWSSRVAHNQCSSDVGVRGAVVGLQMNGSLARKAIQMLMAQGTIRAVSKHANQVIYTRATNT